MGKRRNQKARGVHPTLSSILNSENASSHSPPALDDSVEQNVITAHPLALADTRASLRRRSRDKKAELEIETESKRRSTRLQSKKLHSLNKENVNACEEDASLSKPKPKTKTKRKRCGCSPVRNNKRKRVGVGKEDHPPPLSPGTGVDAVETGSNSLPNTFDSGIRKVATEEEEKEKKKENEEKEEGSQNKYQHKNARDDNCHSSTITMAKMQNLYSKLHGKYQKLKGRKLDDAEAYIEEQNKKFTTYVNVAEELLDHLRNDNNRLRAEVNESMALNKARLLEHQNAQCQSELLTERSKNLILVKEVKRLEQLLSRQEYLCNQGQIMNLQETGTESFSFSEKSVVLQPERRHETNLDPCCTGSGVLSNIFPSSSKADMVQTETNQNICNNCLPESRLTIKLPEKTLVYNAGRRAGSHINKWYALNQGHKPYLEDADTEDISNSGCARANRLFQTLLQCMVGMQFSVVSERNELQLLVLHESSGLTFTLKCLSNEDDPKLTEGELLYSSVSLGTLQKIAPKWMKEEIVFSVDQVNVFFDKILQVANGRGHNLMVR